MKRIKLVAPVTTTQWNALALEQLESHKDVDTQIDFVNVSRGPESIECSYDLAWTELQTVLECEKAEEHGYDGVITYCFLDPGLRAAKEKLSIPVVGLHEAAIHYASLLGSRFAIITVGPPELYMVGALWDKLRLYGLAHKCTSIRSLSIPVLGLQGDKAKEGDMVLEEAEKAILEDGADTIVFGCGSIFGADERVQKELGVPVVLPGVAALKVCEDLIAMGIAQSKRFFPTPPSKNRDK